MSEPFKGTDAFIAGVIDLLIEYFRVFFFPDLESLGFIPTRPLGWGASASGGSMSGQRRNVLFLFFFISVFFFRFSRQGFSL